MRKFESLFARSIATLLLMAAGPVSTAGTDGQLASIAAQRIATAAVRAAADRQRAAAAAAVTAAVEKQRAAARQHSAAIASTKPVASFRWVQLPALPAAFGLTFECEPLPRQRADPLVEEASRREGLSPDLLRAVIEQESAFRPCAVSPKGALGLMQLMPSLADRYGISDPFDPEQNIDIGAKYLKELVSRYGGDVSLALGAYNAGPVRVDASKGVPPIAETTRYVEEILRKTQGR